MSRDRDDPPSHWSPMRHVERGDFPSNWSPFPVAKLTEDIYFGWADGDVKPWFYHWCGARNLWAGAGTGGHELVAREPLHLEPSLLWPYCNLHGWVRNGIWSDA